MSTYKMNVAGIEISPKNSPFVIAEIGAAHNGRQETCLQLIIEAKRAGANAVKFQAFTPDTITIDSDRDEFIIKSGPWQGRKLYDLYTEAHTPRSWFPSMFSCANENNIPLFPSVFSSADVDYVMSFNPAAFKIASFESNDLGLIRYCGQFGLPMFISTGVSSSGEMWAALDAADKSGADGVMAMNCVSEYPAPVSDADLSYLFGRGISDHSLGIEVPVAAVALGAVAIEKHITISRNGGGLDDGFATEPDEFAEMVTAVTNIWHAVNNRGAKPDTHRPYRRSLYVVRNVRCGEDFTPVNVRSIRPGNGMHPACLARVLGRKAVMDIEMGTPLTKDLIA